MTLTTASPSPRENAKSYDAHVQACAQGDRDSFLKVFNFYAPRVKAYLRRLNTNESEAEELGLFEENAIRLIEWPDRLPELADAAAFEINLSNVSGQEFARICTINAQPDRLKQLAERLESSSDIALS